jgi:uncharacterized Zn-finger protein
MNDQKQRIVEVTAKDLPLTCPMPGDSLWNAHPKVVIGFGKEREARCPYCGTLYRLTGELPHAHH